MKNLFSFFVLLSALTLTTDIQSTESLSADQQDLRSIFHQDFLNNDQNADLFYIYAGKVLEETHSPATPNELIHCFKQESLTPEVENRYLSIYASLFNEEEAKEVQELLQNELYQKHHRTLGTAQFYYLQETLKVLKELAPTLQVAASIQPCQDVIIHVTQENIQALMASKQPLIIDVYTEWCGPCKSFATIFKEASQEWGQDYRFAKLDAAQEPALADFFQITAVPTILFIKDGKQVGRHEGFLSKDKFAAKIKHYFGSENK